MADALALLAQIDLVEFCERHRIRNFSIFGSYANGTFTAVSDLDVLVEFEEPTSLLRHLEIKLELEHDLGVKVDLLTPDGINPRLKDSILKSRKTVYEKAG